MGAQAAICTWAYCAPSPARTPRRPVYRSPTPKASWLTEPGAQMR